LSTAIVGLLVLVEDWEVESCAMIVAKCALPPRAKATHVEGAVDGGTRHAAAITIKIMNKK